MVGNLAVIGLGLVEVLDQVIPASPFPNDLACLVACGLNLDQAIGLKVRTLHALGSSARSDGFLFFDPFPTDGQNIPVGEFDGVMVRQTLCAVILELPNEIPVPIEFLKSESAALARTAERVNAIAKTVAARVLADQEIQDHMLRTPPENKELAGTTIHRVGRAGFTVCRITTYFFRSCMPIAEGYLGE